MTSRIILSDLCEAIEYVNETISITLLIGLLQNIDELKILSDRNANNRQLTMSLTDSFINTEAIQHVISTLYALKAEPLLSDYCEFEQSKGFMMPHKNEVDALEAYSKGFIVYLYSASLQQSGSIVDNLITKCFKSASRKVKFSITESQRDVIDDFCNVLEEKNSRIDFYTQKPERIDIKDLAL